MQIWWRVWGRMLSSENGLGLEAKNYSLGIVASGLGLELCGFAASLFFRKTLLYI